VLLDEKNLVVVIAIIAFTFTFLGVFLVAMAYVNVKANARRQLELVRNAFETQEKERSRIARDLHDSIGQQISAIRLHLGLLTTIEDKTELRNAILEKQVMLVKTNEELRMITRNLMPVSISEYGISSELNELADSLFKTNDIVLTIVNNDVDKRYRSDFEINLYRIIQEMINNTVKYAYASDITVDLKHGGEYLLVNYADNGSGFDPDKVKHGLGLRNIEARTKFYHGEYFVNSTPGSGTKFFLKFRNKEVDIINE
jgi:signal transduction histidine kinase